LFGVEQCLELAGAVDARQSHASFVFLPVAAIRDWQAPAARKSSERIFERVRRCDFTASEADNLVAVAQTAAEGVA
jgi:hypothetical protein